MEKKNLDNGIKPDVKFQLPSDDKIKYDAYKNIYKYLTLSTEKEIEKIYEMIWVEASIKMRNKIKRGN